jgi:hypothetical protein
MGFSYSCIIDLENNSQIGVDNLERVTNSSPDLSHSSVHSYLDVVGEDGHMSPYQQLVAIDPTDIHEYEKPINKEIKDIITDILNPEVQLDNKFSTEHALNDSVDIAGLKSGELFVTLSKLSTPICELFSRSISRMDSYSS